jgi:hypothetical protein
VTVEPIVLVMPRGDARQRESFRRFVRKFAAERAGRGLPSPAVPKTLTGALRVAALVLRDLHAQGWRIDVVRSEVQIWPQTPSADPHTEKQRIRGQELLKRQEQLLQPSVQRFVRGLEKPVVFNARPVSIRSLVRDGNEFADALASHVSRGGSYADFREIVRPVVEIVERGARCDATGLRLIDIWRYFRHTWSSQYNSVPGRTMQILIRDAARKDRPVLGIAALSSAVVQIEQRDRWIGWDPALVVARLEQRPTAKAAKWIWRRATEGLAEIYVGDFLEDGTVSTRGLYAPSAALIQELRDHARERRDDHNRLTRQSDLKRPDLTAGKWERRARSELFRSRRAQLLADVLSARKVLKPYFSEGPTAIALKRALASSEGRKAVHWIVRRAKSERVGTLIADLTVCGALDPYRPLTTGKLISMLAVSPEVLRSYVDRYANTASEIASSIAGRPIVRDSRVAFVGTTSLYGTASSQYNRLKMPSDLLGGDHGAWLEYKRLGGSKSYGTSHLSEETVRELSALASRGKRGVRVNSVFGEGVNPKMRKVRLGIDALGWPHGPLLKHGRERLVYGVSLTGNLADFLLGVDRNPKYLIDMNRTDSVDVITEWWYHRWASRRLVQPSVLESVRSHSASSAAHHGAMVELLPDED